jgi:hypothetical protein
MPHIALLEDRGPQRETLLRNIEDALPEGWACLPAPLFENIGEFPNWIIQNDVWVLLADHFLDEKATEPGSNAVDYKAPDVISTIRAAIPYFPVFVLTSYPENADVLEHLAEAEAVANRRDFSEKINVNLERMIRAANRFAKQHEDTLVELGALAQQAAEGEITAAKRKRMKALQASIGLGLDADSISDRAKLLSELEHKLEDSDKLSKKIKQFLKKRR